MRNFRTQGQSQREKMPVASNSGHYVLPVMNGQGQQMHFAWINSSNDALKSKHRNFNDQSLTPSGKIQIGRSYFIFIIYY